jgi:hypothetical protein
MIMIVVNVLKEELMFSIVVDVRVVVLDYVRYVKHFVSYVRNICVMNVLFHVEIVLSQLVSSVNVFAIRSNNNIDN